ELREPDDVGATFTNERAVLHDRNLLTLAGVKHQPRTVFPAGDAHCADARRVRVGIGQPSYLASGQPGAIRADGNRAVQHVQESVVRIGQLLSELCPWL